MEGFVAVLWGRSPGADREPADQLIAQTGSLFALVFTEEDVGMLPMTEVVFKGDTEEELKEISLHREDVLQLFDKLKSSKSPGLDGMHPRVLKELKYEIADLLLVISELSLKSSVIPEDWRIANVTPIFKKGSRGDPGNYRPVSLTSVLGKMVETIIKNKINQHVDQWFSTFFVP